MKALFSIFKKGLEKTSTSISRSLESLFKDVKHWTKEDFNKLESTLISADFGLATAKKITADIKDRYERGLISSSDDILKICAEDIKKLFQEHSRELRTAPPNLPTVIMMVGVNGSGKTTTCGKLAGIFVQEGKKVILCACDTFRAAAGEQLKLWADRTSSEIIMSKSGADPAAVAFDASKAAVARRADYLIIDTAGRQHTKKGLMEELAKICRVVSKNIPDAPHETLLTIDATTGSNALNQAREFAKFANVTGLVLTKLDGSGKGGAVVAIHNELKLPVLFIGLGEQIGDLQPFEPEFFSNAIFAKIQKG